MKNALNDLQAIYECEFLGQWPKDKRGKYVNVLPSRLDMGRKFAKALKELNAIADGKESDGKDGI